MAAAQLPVARFSENRVYRYLLTRRVGFGDRMIQFIMLNPSTADEQSNDNTVRRCIAFANRWGYGWLAVTNVSPFRSPDPKDLKSQGMEPHDVWWTNLENIAETAVCADTVVAAWGTAGKWEQRGERVLAMLEPLVNVWCLRQTKDGYPNHPLYLPDDVRLEIYREKVIPGNQELKRCWECKTLTRAHVWYGNTLCWDCGERAHAYSERFHSR